MKDFASRSALRARRFYSAAWRWHFYAGVGVLPFVLVLALSGLAMLASEPIDRHLQSHLLAVTVGSDRLPAERQAAAVARAYPHVDLVTYRAARSPAESTRIDVEPKHASGEHAGHGAPGSFAVFVDPYTGVVLGDLDPSTSVYAQVKALHGTLLLGTIGDYLIEIVASLGVLLIASGLYLWWPRGDRPLRVALAPGFGAAGRRRWRDLHGAVGAWTAPFLLFFLVSGLAWTPFWGAELVQAWSSLPGERLAAPLSSETHATLERDSHRTVPWALAQTPLPASGSTLGAPGIAAAHPVALEDVIGYAHTAGFESFRVHWPRGEHGVWTIAATTIGGDTLDPRGDRVVHLDPATGNVLADIRLADYSPMGKLMAAGIPLHQGDAGALNLAVNALVCLAVLGLGAAGAAAWWARRPAGARRLVPPPLPRDARVWRTAVAIMLALALVFPLAALTIAAVLAADVLLVSRVRALRVMLQ